MFLSIESTNFCICVLWHHVCYQNELLDIICDTEFVIPVLIFSNTVVQTYCTLSFKKPSIVVNFINDTLKLIDSGFTCSQYHHSACCIQRAACQLAHLIMDIMIEYVITPYLLSTCHMVWIKPDHQSRMRIDRFYLFIVITITTNAYPRTQVHM